MLFTKQASTNMTCHTFSIDHTFSFSPLTVTFSKLAWKNYLVFNELQGYVKEPNSAHKYDVVSPSAQRYRVRQLVERGTTGQQQRREKFELREIQNWRQINSTRSQTTPNCVTTSQHQENRGRGEKPTTNVREREREIERERGRERERETGFKDVADKPLIGPIVRGFYKKSWGLSVTNW
jgi:hypothetical protein